MILSLLISLAASGIAYLSYETSKEVADGNKENLEFIMDKYCCFDNGLHVENNSPEYIFINKKYFISNTSGVPIIVVSCMEEEASSESIGISGSPCQAAFRNRFGDKLRLPFKIDAGDVAKIEFQDRVYFGEATKSAYPAFMAQGKGNFILYLCVNRIELGTVVKIHPYASCLRGYRPTGYSFSWITLRTGRGQNFTIGDDPKNIPLDAQ